MIPPPTLTSQMRELTAADLVRLRDIGPVSNADVRAHFLELSPDGSQIAFQMRRADPVTNSYCLGMFVMRLESNRAPIPVDMGGEFIVATFPSWGFAIGTPPGTPAAITPKWSPDGHSIAFLRRDKGVTQAWTARADGTGSAQATHFDFNVENVGWASDGHTLVVSGRPGLNSAYDAIEDEGKSGFLYDDRYIPVTGSRPVPREPVPTDYYAVELATGKLTSASQVQRALLTPKINDRPREAILFARASNGGTAWTSSSDASNVNAKTRLQVSKLGSPVFTCTFAACTDAIDLWWTGDDRSVVFMRHEGWGGSQTALYRWQPGRTAPVRILLTENVLLGCRMGQKELICGEEKSLQPRRLVSVDPETGAVAPLFDPNPEFAALHLGEVRRLNWKNKFGIETFGDLVLPADYKSGNRYPLIVVQYESRGFLRGGTGDEFPIQYFAAKGFSVLTVQRPDDIGSRQKAKSWLEVERLNREDWSDFRSVQSSLGTGADLAVKAGIAEPGRIGLTGLSNGASNAQFALINSRAFAAIAMSNCCEEPAIVTSLVGPAFASALQTAGYPRLTQEDRQFWAPMSIIGNAAHIEVPLLIQIPDREYLGAVESVTALKEQGRPVEMYVYPDEYHIKWQPAHRLASYERSLDWFSFWLRNVEDPGSGKADQYRRWSELRDHNKSLSATPGP
jgi:dipeptidyl aminopeptidase/acylaminoacyl peptidase